MQFLEILVLVYKKDVKNIGSWEVLVNKTESANYVLWEVINKHNL